jgi:hemerythrin-like metal-binding protein
LEAIAWNDDYSVNVREIDSQHKKLVVLISKLTEMKEGVKSAESDFGPILDELVKYTVYHFSFEESLFAKYSYPETRTHIRTHTDLIEQVKKYITEFNAKGNINGSDLIEFLKRWLLDHIMGDDKKYGEYLNSKGIY